MPCRFRGTYHGSLVSKQIDVFSAYCLPLTSLAYRLSREGSGIPSFLEARRAQLVSWSSSLMAQFCRSWCPCPTARVVSVCLIRRGFDIFFRHGGILRRQLRYFLSCVYTLHFPFHWGFTRLLVLTSYTDTHLAFPSATPTPFCKPSTSADPSENWSSNTLTHPDPTSQLSLHHNPSNRTQQQSRLPAPNLPAKAPSPTPLMSHHHRNDPAPQSSLLPSPDLSPYRLRLRHYSLRCAVFTCISVRTLRIKARCRRKCLWIS